MQRQSDENTPLINGDGRQEPRERRPLSFWVRLLRWLNPLVSRRPWRLFEFCDLSICPGFVRRRCQAMLTAEWTHRLPWIQKKSPAEMAANLIIRTLDRVQGIDDTKFSIIDFCSGAGGPVPVIEKLVNAKRTEQGRPPIPFLLSDIQPHLDAWMNLAERSDNLSFVPQAVDATDPPIAVISTTSSLSNDPSSGFASDTRVFRLYCLAFHHFDDELAKKVLKSTMATADGFAIIELQDRRLWSLVLMVADFFLLFGVSIFWFWHDPLQLLLTYVIPAVPSICAFDGFISSLRTREFDEVVGLVDVSAKENVKYIVDAEEKEVSRVEVNGWSFLGGREMHSWPLGYMNYVIGQKLKST